VIVFHGNILAGAVPAKAEKTEAAIFPVFWNLSEKSIST